MRQLFIFIISFLVFQSAYAKHEFFGIIALKGSVNIYQQEEGKWLRITNRNYYHYDEVTKKTKFFEIYAHDSIKLDDDAYLILLDNLNQKYLEITSASSFEAKSLHHDIKKEFKKHSEIHATEWFYPIIESMFDTVNFHSIKSKLECKRCITTYNIIAPPTGVFVKKGNDPIRFRWKSTAGAGKYTFFVNNFFGEHLKEVETKDTALSFDIASLYDPEEENQLFWGAKPDNFSDGTLNFNSVIIAPEELIAKIDAEYSEHKLDTANSVFDKFLAATIYYKNGFYFDSGRIYDEISEELSDVFTYQLLMIHNRLLLGEISESEAHKLISNYYKEH